MQATDGSVGGTAGRDRTQRPNILKRRLSNNVRVEIENKAGDQHDDLGEPEMNRPRILPDEPRRDFNLRQDVLQLPHEIGLKKKLNNSCFLNKNFYNFSLANKGNTCYVNATFQALFVLQDFVEDLKKLLIKKKELHPCLELFVNLALARRNGVTFEVDKLLT